ncbi:MAG TPA: SelB C-terminal domain-containing protein, partial [Gemmatimonadaceae bacterium]|nr:SelB C-terminal domain-containing protein [Gemmatimonadaceae bacterium]
EVRVLLADTPFAHAPVVPVAAPRGDGIAELRAVLVDALREAQPRAAGDLFRMPVDRVFTVRGTGTVVTGTVWSGTLARDAEVRLLPSGRTARVRGVQNHGQATDRILPGQRAAIALVGVDVADVARGDVVVADGAWQASTVLRADLALLDDAPRALGPRTAVRLHLGTAEVGARVVAADGSMEPGQYRPVRLMLDAPVVARAGDRFVLRSASPLATIGGGVISDPHAARRSRPFAETGLDAAARLATLLREAGVQGLAAGSLAIRLGVMPTQVELVLRAAEAVLPVADRVIAAGLLDELEGRLVAELDGYHRDNPLAPAAPVHEIRARLGVPAWVADELVGRAVGAGDAEIEGAGIRRTGWKPALSDAQSRLLIRLLERLSAAGKEPPSVPELEGEFGSESGPLLRHAARAGSVVQVELDRYYASGEFDQILARIETLMAGRDEVSPAELREGVGLSRKYLIPFLEYLDREGYTVRLASGRRWAGRGRRA